MSSDSWIFLKRRPMCNFWLVKMKRYYSWISLKMGLGRVKKFNFWLVKMKGYYSWISLERGQGRVQKLNFWLVKMKGYYSWISLKTGPAKRWECWPERKSMLMFWSPKDAAVPCKFTRMYWNCIIKMLLLLTNLTKSLIPHNFWWFLVFFVNILERPKLL